MKQRREVAEEAEEEGREVSPEVVVVVAPAEADAAAIRRVLADRAALLEACKEVLPLLDEPGIPAWGQHVVRDAIIQATKEN